MKIAIISGSPREGSVTRRVALHLYGIINRMGNVDADLIDAGEIHLPFVQKVIGSVDEAPMYAKTLAKRIIEADAFILVSPEYNGGYSPALKNLMDHFPKQDRKAFGIVTASPGVLGGIRAALQLQNLIFALFGVGSPYMLIVPEVDKKFSERGQPANQSIKDAADHFVNEFLWLADSLYSKRPGVIGVAV